MFNETTRIMSYTNSQLKISRFHLYESLLRYYVPRIGVSRFRFANSTSIGNFLSRDRTWTRKPNRIDDFLFCTCHAHRSLRRGRLRGNFVRRKILRDRVPLCSADTCPRRVVKCHGSFRDAFRHRG